MRSWTSWQDWSELVLGLWLLVTPWAVGPGGAVPEWNAWILGAAVVIVALWALAAPVQAAAEIVMDVLGVWLFIAPWVLGFSDLAAQAWNAWIVAVLLVVLATWRYGVVKSAQ
jgi:hypothetical protein